MVIRTIFILSVILINNSILVNAYSETPPSAWLNVRDFGALGDGKSDDTAAFQAALDAAAPDGRVVLVPPCAKGKGYVLTRTVHMPPAVTLMGSPAGFGTNGFSAYPLPENNVIGAKIFARPTPDQYEGANKAPLITLEPGCTVRGLYILYDEQPWPTDEEFLDAASPFHYATFEDARARFMTDHVKPCGPTFYSSFATNIVIEDINCDRFTDFVFFPFSGKTFINRIFLYGYNRSFTYVESLDVNRLSGVHGVPNVGPACPGKVGDKNYSWMYGVVTGRPDNVGVLMGRADGYTLSDVFFFGIHTAIRLGCSKEYPIIDPVTGTRFYFDTEAKKTIGFQGGDYEGQGPWGEATAFKVDQCNIGIHFVWPSHLANRFANALIFTAVDDGRDFNAVAGTGELKGVARQAALLVEPSYSIANNKGLAGTFLCSNLLVASFNDVARFGPGAADASAANGRFALVDGDITMELDNTLMNFPYIPDRHCARGANAGAVSIRMRGFVHNGVPLPDMFMDGAVSKPNK